MNTEEHTKTVKREIHYQLAIHIVSQVHREGLLAVMLDRGISMEEITESDRHNASLREDYGDTPYCAPDVDQTSGKCDGGDAWPVCCRGHRFEDYWADVLYEGDSERGISHRYTGNTPNHPAALTVFDAELVRREAEEKFPSSQWTSPEARELFLQYGHEGPPTT